MTSAPPVSYWIGLGSNLGDRLGNLDRAIDELSTRGLAIEASSSVFETAPQDLEDQPAFLNAVAQARSGLSPPAVLDACKGVEAALDRDPDEVRYGPRPIDCDILLWSGGSWEDLRLVIPHPRLAERRFALLPLLELDPDARWPDGSLVADSLSAIAPEEQPARRVHEPLRKLD